MSSSLVPVANRLARSSTEKRFAGVCGGIAQYWQIDPMIVRIVFVALAFGGGISLVLYPVLWMIMPTAVAYAAHGSQPSVQPSAQAKFDPMTGRPIAETPRFDPYTGQPLPVATSGASLSTVERRRRILNVALVGLAGMLLIQAVANLSALAIPALLIIGGVMLLRRVS